MKYTFVSGASGGIGKAFCFYYAAQGDNLYITGRSDEKLSALKEKIIERNPSVTVLYYACDLTKESERNGMVADMKEKGVAINRICNVAGVDIQKPFEDYTDEKVLFQIRVNVEATIDLTHKLLKLRDGETEIITISSMSGASPMPYFALYSASKAMLTNFFTSLHYELKDKGVKVTTVLPGGVYTRPDVCEDIKGQGVWGKLSAKSPEFVARKSAKAVRKNKITYVPGFFNKFLKGLMKIAPKRVVLSFIANRWKKQTKDAF